MSYKIEKGIPYLSRHNRYPTGEPRKKRDLSKWQFAESMEVGDSVLLESDTDRAALRHYLLDIKGFGWQLKSKSVDNGIRIWRTR